MLFGVSVGCGDPEDMTLKAVKTLEKCDTIFVPRTNGRKSLALEIASQAVSMDDKSIINLDFPMTNDRETLSRAHISAADAVCDVLRTKDAAMICLGDVSIYTTFAYIAAIVAERGFEVKWLPGVSSVTAAACAACTPLALGDQPIMILPYACGSFDEMLGLYGTKVIMKSGKNAPQFIEKLKERGIIDRCIAVENVGLDGEHVVTGDNITDDTGYFTVFIIPAE